jgi:hypothetical protein
LAAQSRADTTFDGYFATEREFRFRVSFSNALTTTDEPCGFAIRWQEEEALLVTAKSIQERYGRGYEILSYMVSMPVKVLHLSVQWPVEGDHRAFPSVTYGPTETVVTAEQRRLIAGFMQSDLTARLTIESPQIGLRYMIAWRGIRLPNHDGNRLPNAKPHRKRLNSPAGVPFAACPSKPA